MDDNLKLKWRSTSSFYDENTNSIQIIGKIIKPSREEINLNARSRSAILRIGEKTSGQLDK